MTGFRKIITFREVINAELGEGRASPVTRIATAAIVANPFAGRFVHDLSPLYELGRDVGIALAENITSELRGPAVAYGKAALVGINGEMEHGGACIHPMLGKPMRDAIGGGEAVLPSNVKVAAPGTPLDVPLGHKDNVWSFDHFDTMTIYLADAPRPDEIAIVLAFADGGRPFPRCGSGPV